MLRIYNSLSGKKDAFIPIEKGRVKIYVCGPTTYNYFHLGNGRAFLFFDVVRSYLTYKGMKVTYVQNLTDIDDKIIKRAQEENSTPEKIARKYIKAYKEDIKALGIKKASFYPKATEYIAKMVDFIKLLEEKGNAYDKNGTVFFSVRSIADYGKLSGKKMEEQMSGARVEQNEDKNFSNDFALWKKAKAGEIAWDSPWGKGRPGWHTECVVMANDLLASKFDIHAGGTDLIFPHHENEMAQAKAAFNSDLANYWMHNGFVNVDGEKMSKSLGNFWTIRDILQKYDAETVRYFYLSKHYRSPIDYNEEILQECSAAVQSLYQPLRELGISFINSVQFTEPEETFEKKFQEAMDDDFNTARALAVMFDLLKVINAAKIEDKKKFVAVYLKLGAVLGFFDDIEAKFKVDADVEKFIWLLISYRQKFKEEKNFVYADMIRDDLKKYGVVIQDTKEGVKWFYLPSQKGI